MLKFNRLAWAAVAGLVAVLMTAGTPATAQLTGPAPDLVPQQASILQGTVSVRNVGSANAGPFVVTVQCQKQGGGSCAEHPGMAAYTKPAYPNRLVVSVPGLAKGAVFNHNLRYWSALVWGPGNYNFILEADPAKIVAETNEGNNIAGVVLQK